MRPCVFCHDSASWVFICNFWFSHSLVVSTLLPPLLMFFSSSLHLAFVFLPSSFVFFLSVITNKINENIWNISTLCTQTIYTHKPQTCFSHASSQKPLITKHNIPKFTEKMISVQFSSTPVL